MLIETDNGDAMSALIFVVRDRCAARYMLTSQTAAAPDLPPVDARQVRTEVWALPGLPRLLNRASGGDTVHSGGAGCRVWHGRACVAEAKSG